MFIIATFRIIITIVLIVFKEKMIFMVLILFGIQDTYFYSHSRVNIISHLSYCYNHVLLFKYILLL